MPTFSNLKAPTTGTAISGKGGRLIVPDDPIVPFIEGDGTGPDIWRASVRVLRCRGEESVRRQEADRLVRGAAGEKAKEQFGEWLPNDTLEAFRTYKVAIKGPLTTPVGGGIRSLNVTLRQVLDLYVCVRPVRYSPACRPPSPIPRRMNVVIFRENTEDVYAGIEWAERHAAGGEGRSSSSSREIGEADPAPIRASASSRSRREVVGTEAASSEWRSSTRS